MSKHASDNSNDTVNIIVQNEKFAPVYSHETDAGADVRSTVDVTLQPRQVTQVPLGFKMDLPDGAWVKIEGRSSLATQGIFPVGGVIDSGYHGEFIALLTNITEEPFEIHVGDRVAQIVIHPRYQFEFQEVEAFDRETDRGEGGLGSTGVN